MLHGGCIVDVVEYVFKPGKGVNLMLLASFNEGEEDTASVSAGFIAMKEPVFTTNNKRFNSTLRAIVINFQTAVIEITTQRVQMSGCIEDGLP